jgi:hypothetical protein
LRRYDPRLAAVTEIEIRDPDPPEGSAAPAPGPESPYRNLLVPLVVVPALIVMVLVLVFVLFGAVAGEEDSPRQNLDRLLNGGFNERKQAAFNLVRQVIDYRKASRDGGQPEWEIDATFLPALREARAQVAGLESSKDVAIPLVLSSLLAQLGEPEGVAQLAELLALPDELDPEGEYRMYSAVTLGSLGPQLAAPEREVAARALIGLLSNPDPAMVLVAIAALQTLPSEGTVPALAGLLTSQVLEQRGTAALSLAALGDASGRGVLEEMLLPAPYEAERAADERKWPPQRVSESRCKALAALAALGTLPEEAELRALANTDSDAAFRTLAMQLVEGDTDPGETDQ